MNLTLKTIALALSIAATSPGYTQSNSIRSPSRSGHDIFQMWVSSLSKLDPKDFDKVTKLFAQETETLASQGDSRAQYFLGQLYAQGIGKEKSPMFAKEWFLQSAEQGNPDAQFALYRLLDAEKGNPQETIFWLRTAAEQGYVIAQLTLAGEYIKGTRIPKNNKETYFWLILAATIDNPKIAELRDGAALRIDAKERTEVEDRALNWRPVPSAPVSPPSKSPRHTRQGTTPETTGSGFRIASNIVITNYHVIANCSVLKVDGHRVQVVGSDPKSDLAALKSDDKRSFGKLTSKRASLGEQISAAGFPLRGVLTGLNVTNGNISSLSGINGDTRLLQISAPVQPGNSGGPLLDWSGNIVGVVVSKLDAIKTAQATGDIPQNVNFAINVNTLRGFLDANSLDYETAASDKSITPASIAQKAQIFTTLVECWK